MYSGPTRDALWGGRGQFAVAQNWGRRKVMITVSYENIKDRNVIAFSGDLILIENTSACARISIPIYPLQFPAPSSPAVKSWVTLWSSMWYFGKEG